MTDYAFWPEAEPDPAEGALLRCIDRLEELIDMETASLRAGERIDFDSINLRKTHAMLEFARLARGHGEPTSGIVESRLRGLRERLTHNAGMLELHLQAMTEITGLIVDSIRQEESYGAYSRQSATRR